MTLAGGGSVRIALGAGPPPTPKGNDMSQTANIDDVLSGRARWCVVTGDCLAVLPTLPKGCVDAVVTDPPYGIGYGYASYDDTQENLSHVVGMFVPEARRVATRVLVFPGINNVWIYPRADWVLSWSWRSTSHFGMAGYSMWQPVLMYGKDVESFGNVEGELKADSMHFPDGNGIGFLAAKRENHPCPKPEKVMTWLAKRFARSGDVILDPFAGSGTTGVAAIRNGRRFIGIEIDEGYAAIARRRIAEAADTLWTPPPPKPEQVEMFA